MLIGIVGKAQSGKDTVAALMKDMFLEQHSMNFELVAFADYLKELCTKYFNLTYEQVYGDKKEWYDVDRPKVDGSCWNAREIMQFVGESVRSVDRNFWVKELNRRIKGYDNVILTDVRHLNEFKYVKNNDGYVLNIQRENRKKIETNTHISEVSLDRYESDSYDFVIVNSYTMNELKIVVESTVDMIIKLEILKKTWGC